MIRLFFIPADYGFEYTPGLFYFNDFSVLSKQNEVICPSAGGRARGLMAGACPCGFSRGTLLLFAAGFGEGKTWAN